jgi:hypothetical protein
VFLAVNRSACSYCGTFPANTTGESDLGIRTICLGEIIILQGPIYGTAANFTLKSPAISLIPSMTEVLFEQPENFTAYETTVTISFRKSILGAGTLAPEESYKNQ